MAAQQLTEYFNGSRTTFELPLAPAGTAFQQQVWRALLDISYGHTACYGDIARAINNPKGVRAVGLANSRNPIAIIIPCHRIIGANGTLTGYAGGLDKKEWLLRLENAL
jgi:methylated-DNA-[protein]-cysteine S-methyltransferase